MKFAWSQPKMTSNGSPDRPDPPGSEQPKDFTAEHREGLSKPLEGRASPIENRPIEPEQRKFGKPSLLKWLIFLLLIGYALLSYYHAPILTRIGDYLVIQQPLEKADVIVCLAGSPVDRGLETADLYEKGFAPHILITRPQPPAGQEILKQRGIYYPERTELLMELLSELGVVRSACITSDRFVESTFDEALVVRDLAHEKGFRSMIVVTSPIHTRRAWLTFRRVMEKDGIRIIMAPSKYSDFKARAWWKTGEYVEKVIMEYQKLIYYALKYF